MNNFGLKDVLKRFGPYFKDYIPHFIFAIIGIFIFSLYVGYDWARGQQYPSTASYACFTALQLYMDIINIFIRILRLLGKRR